MYDVFLILIFTNINQKSVRGLCNFDLDMHSNNITLQTFYTTTNIEDTLLTHITTHSLMYINIHSRKGLQAMFYKPINEEGYFYIFDHAHKTIISILFERKLCWTLGSSVFLLYLINFSDLLKLTSNQIRIPKNTYLVTNDKLS